MSERIASPKPLRVLSLWQPWATLMAIGAKQIETRSWSTNYRGLVCIHAAKKWNDDLFHTATQEPFLGTLTRHGIAMPGDLPFGAVLAIAELTAVFRTEDIRDCLPSTAPHEADFGGYEDARFGWVFCNLVKLAEPIPLKASQGLFGASPELRKAISAQLGIEA